MDIELSKGAETENLWRKQRKTNQNFLINLYPKLYNLSMFIEENLDLNSMKTKSRYSRTSQNEQLRTYDQILHHI